MLFRESVAPALIHFAVDTYAAVWWRSARGRVFVVCRYLKYLTKKFLKKHNVRDWLRVIASNKDRKYVHCIRLASVICVVVMQSAVQGCMRSCRVP